MEQLNIFIPLFNIEVDEKFLDKPLFNDYKILKSRDILYNITQYVFADEPFTKSFVSDISQNGVNKILLHPYAKFVLFKQIFVNNEAQEFFQTKEKIKSEIDDILLSLRLVSNGFIQINNCYFIGNGHSAYTQMKSSSQIENICISHRSRKNKLLCEDLYCLNEKCLKDALEIYSLINNIKNKETMVVVEFFHKYFNSQTPYDKIINLAIILESTMLFGKNSELNYRLFLRTSTLLNKNVKDVLEVFYTIRSEVVHNGIIQERKNKKDIYAKVSNITGIERDDYTELIFYFIKDFIEPIVREIILKSFKIFTSNNQISNYDELNKDIDKFILDKISKDYGF